MPGSVGHRFIYQICTDYDSWFVILVQGLHLTGFPAMLNWHAMVWLKYVSNDICKADQMLHLFLFLWTTRGYYYSIAKMECWLDSKRTLERENEHEFMWNYCVTRLVTQPSQHVLVLIKGWAFHVHKCLAFSLQKFVCLQTKTELNYLMSDEIQTTCIAK